MSTRTVACTLLLGACGAVNAQYWDTGGNFISTTTQYLGCDGGSNQPLRLMTKASYPIDFSTTDIFRARINPQITYGLLGSFNNVPADGFALITPNASFLGAVKGPFSRLHLADGGTGNTQALAYRPWMSNPSYLGAGSITFTGMPVPC
ncbi:MAG: hypothetical protein M9900_05410 [Flavobacteriales bacterium]|nr:hypothetical protein [Flavobacteriales bacterium]HRN38458.1 hypothetical protein [Flavobacteriales bacterium]